jgi:hypothetical protein
MCFSELRRTCITIPTVDITIPHRRRTCITIPTVDIIPPSTSFLHHHPLSTPLLPTNLQRQTFEANLRRSKRKQYNVHDKGLR